MLRWVGCLGPCDFSTVAEGGDGRTVGRLPAGGGSQLGKNLAPCQGKLFFLPNASFPPQPTTLTKRGWAAPAGRLFNGLLQHCGHPQGEKTRCRGANISGGRWSGRDGESKGKGIFGDAQRNAFQGQCGSQCDGNSGQESGPARNSALGGWGALVHKWRTSGHESRGATPWPNLPALSPHF